jgi:general nucleoside transport system permease protein
MDLIIFLVQKTMLFSIPLLVVALGGMFSERSGIVNIALDGIMIFGAFCSVLFLNFMQDYMSGQLLLILAIFVAGISGVIISLLHGYASINLNADQVISGTAINLLAPAVAIYVARMVQGVQQITFDNTFRISSVPVLSDIPIIGPMFFKQAYITTYIGFGILVAAVIILYKTRFGLRLRACGEHPQAADSVGINVYKMRYAGVMISGFLGGLGGLIFVVPTSTEFNSTVSGYGFLALAVMIFGNWKPLPILGAALFFGFMKTIAAAYSGIPWLLDLNIDSAFFKMTPYVATLIVLAFTSKKSQAPRAEGIPYDKGQR